MYIVLKKLEGELPEVKFNSVSKINADLVAEYMAIIMLESFVGCVKKPVFYKKSESGCWGKIPTWKRYWICAEPNKYTIYKKWLKRGRFYNQFVIDKVATIFVGKYKINNMRGYSAPPTYQIRRLLPDDIKKELLELFKCETKK